MVRVLVLKICSLIAAADAAAIAITNLSQMVIHNRQTDLLREKRRETLSKEKMR
jgi:hypothetical protein